MKITNVAVVALFAVFVIIGLIALPFDEYIWRFAHLAVILLVGFICTTLGLLGAGDAKFAAAMAPFVALGDAANMLYLLSASAIVTIILHRLLQRSTFIRSRTTGWKSWDNKDFPMGMALGTALVAYLALGAAYGQ
jgi:prepilin peptidase CpaA